MPPIEKLPLGPKLLASVGTALDNANDARQGFDGSDKRINDAFARILESYAKLAEEHPEEFFGLKPSERERFLVREALRPAFDAVSRSSELPEGGTSVDLRTGDVSGSNPAALGLLTAALGGLTDVLKSPQGPAILDRLLGHVEKEKEFVRDTVKDGIGGVISAGQQFVDFIFPGNDDSETRQR